MKIAKIVLAIAISVASIGAVADNESTAEAVALLDSMNMGKVMNQATFPAAE